MNYTWPFDQSFLVFLCIVFCAQALSVRLRSLIPMPLVFGSLFMFGFGTGILPKDLLLSANMIAVGTIAFHVLVIHSGTMLRLPMLLAHKKEVLIAICSALLLIPVQLLLIPLIGKEAAFLAPGSVVGGGASCAIASKWVLDKAPYAAVFPWMIFMFQGLFCIPILTLALKKEAADLLQEFPALSSAQSQMPVPQKAAPLCSRIPCDYKTTAYYLGTIMLVFLLNQRLLSLLPFEINANLSALLLGMLFGHLGLLEQAPLFRSDSYGLLLLGLMGLMANTLANTAPALFLSLLPAVLLALAVSTIVLLLCGYGAARLFHFRPARGIILTMNCMMGFPVNQMLLKHAAAVTSSEEEKLFLTGQLTPLLNLGTVLISNGFSILIVSIFVALV